MPTINPTLPADGDDAIVEPYNTAIQAILGVINGSLDADNIAANAITMGLLATAVQAMLVPSGMIAPFGGSAAPTGWLLCDGGSYLRASYSTLFAVIGTAYGSVDGTHFNVPDLRGRVPVGIDNLGGTAANRLQRTTTLATTNANSTATPASMTGLAVGMIIVSANVPAGTTISSIGSTTIVMSANATATASGVAARFSVVSDAQSLGSVGGTDVHTLIGAQAPSHTHAMKASSTFAGTGATAITFLNNGTSLNYTNELDTQGSDQAHPNMQPSLTTAYIIKT